LQYEGTDVYLSDPYVIYQNVAVSLSSSDFKIDDIRDLNNKTISAFQNASLFLGDFYKELSRGAPYYEEVADQNKQMRHLFEQRVEVVIADVNIYKYFIKAHQSGIFNKGTTVHRIFAERPYVIGFRDKAMRDQFSLGLMALKHSGRFQEILDKYISEPQT